MSVPAEPDTAPAQARSRTAAFLEARLSLRAAAALFWTGVVVFLGLLEFLPESITDRRWFTLGWKAAFNLFVMLWVIADARARDFGEERVKWYVHLSAVLPEFTVPVYLVRSRGWRGAIKAAMRFFGYLFLAAALVVAASGITKVLGT